MFFTVNAFGPAFASGLNDFVGVASVGAGSGKSAYSSDGAVSWTEGDTLPNINKEGVLYGNGAWVCFGGDGPAGFIERSIDGAQTWTSIKSGETRMKSGAFSPELNRFVIVSTKDIGNWYSDDLGASWTFVDNATSVVSIMSPNGCVWAPELGIFLTVPGILNNTVETLYAATSTDGIVWSLHGTGTGAEFHWGAVDWSPFEGKFVAVASETNGGTRRSYYSSNGSAWTRGGDLPSTGNWNAVKWNPILQCFVALKNNSSQGAVSYDAGLTWDAITLSRSSSWTDLACNDRGVYVAADASATVSYTDDLVTWTDVVVPGTTQVIHITNGRL